MLGEGACTLVLEARDRALARGAPVLGEVTGFATNSDGAHVVRPRPETMERVMRDALTDAGVAPDDIGFVSAHATATRFGDVAEGTATAAVFGDRVPVASLKGHTGHTLGACGAFEAWATLNMLIQQRFAPTLNLHQPDPECGELDHVMHEHRRIDAERIMSNNFAFGGINTSLILARHA